MGCWQESELIKPVVREILLRLSLPLTLGKLLSPVPGFLFLFCEVRWYLPAFAGGKGLSGKVII